MDGDSRIRGRSGRFDRGSRSEKRVQEEGDFASDGDIRIYEPRVSTSDVELAFVELPCKASRSFVQPSTSGSSMRSSAGALCFKRPESV